MTARPAAAGLGASSGSAEDRVYAAIHEAIQDHRLVPGTKLKELVLAELFRVSRATVRKVLDRLAHLSLVELRPNRAALVATPSADESREIFQARRGIEEAALALMIERSSPRDLDGMRALVASEQKAYDGGDTRRGLQLAIEFHRRLARLGGNTILADFLEQLMARTPLVALTHRGTGAWSCSTEEHNLILDALEARDLGRATALMRDHLRHLEREAIVERPSPPADLAQVFGGRDAP